MKKILGIVGTCLFALSAGATDPNVGLNTFLVDGGNGSVGGTVVRATILPNDANPAHNYYYLVGITAPSTSQVAIDAVTLIQSGAQTAGIVHDCGTSNRDCVYVTYQQTTPNTNPFVLADFTLHGITADVYYWIDFQWEDIATSTGDGYLSQNTLKVRHLAADANGDTVVGLTDYNVMGQEWGHSCPTCCANFNNDGAVGLPDYSIYSGEYSHRGGATACSTGGSQCCGGQ